MKENLKLDVVWTIRIFLSYLLVSVGIEGLKNQLTKNRWLHHVLPSGLVVAAVFFVGFMLIRPAVQRFIEEDKD
ncbi:hypothetical protein [Vagococcus humatus]|uniref:Uncharacterized protein n=1 Tax=Vagococcus humatus TaxID=1889241 RepID=A0A429Z8J4_9ENTE|nr:hypothetical protein [Vagococcus humatus]RST90011.1 hypothetical protein C7P63_02725 [Vagococcus humatus]